MYFLLSPLFTDLKPCADKYCLLPTSKKRQPTGTNVRKWRDHGNRDGQATGCDDQHLRATRLFEHRDEEVDVVSLREDLVMGNSFGVVCASLKEGQ
jgi:hypothetical protein